MGIGSRDYIREIGRKQGRITNFRGGSDGEWEYGLHARNGKKPNQTTLTINAHLTRPKGLDPIPTWVGPFST